MVLFSCQLCAALGAKTEYWTLDDRKAHAQFHAVQSGCISESGDQMSVKQVFGQCFPSDDFEKSTNIDKNRSTLSEICKRIIANKKNDSKSIECQVCKSNVRYVDKNDYQAIYLILRHVCHHSAKKPFACRECKHESATKSGVVSHVMKVHKITSPVSGVHFDENWLDCFDEVKESLAKSFGEFISSSSTQPSELAIHRRSVFLNASRNANGIRKIQCRQCLVEICALGGTNLEDHIRFHMERQIFDCAMCNRKFIHKLSVSLHLAKKHGAPKNGNYIDRSDEHHEEIMEWVKKCFGNKEGE